MKVNKRCESTDKFFAWETGLDINNLIFSLSVSEPRHSGGNSLKNKTNKQMV